MVIQRRASTYWETTKKVYNSETLKQLARENIIINGKYLDKEIAKKND